MPPFLILNKGNASAFESLCENDQWLIAKADSGEDFEQFIDVMTIDFFGAPAEGFEAAFVNVEVVFESGRLALAKAVDIDNGNEIVELINPGERCGFPNGAFGAFAIAEQDVGTIVEFIEPGAKSHADADTEALAKGACGDISE